MRDMDHSVQNLVMRKCRHGLGLVARKTRDSEPHTPNQSPAGRPPRAGVLDRSTEGWRYFVVVSPEWVDNLPPSEGPNPDKLKRSLLA
jgi:hypothetical protein